MLPHSAMDSDLTDIFLNENLRDYYFKVYRKNIKIYASGDKHYVVRQTDLEQLLNGPWGETVLST